MAKESRFSKGSEGQTSRSIRQLLKTLARFVRDDAFTMTAGRRWNTRGSARCRRYHSSFRELPRASQHCCYPQESGEVRVERGGKGRPGGNEREGEETGTEIKLMLCCSYCTVTCGV